MLITFPFHALEKEMAAHSSANCQSLPQAELFVRQRERPGLRSQAVAWPPRLSAGRRESGSQGPWLVSFWTLCILSFTFQIQVQAHVVQLLFLNDQLFLMTKPQVFWDSSEEVVINLILSMVFVQTVLWDMPDT